MSIYQRFVLLLRSNWISWIGGAMVTTSFLMIVTFYLAIALGFFQGPYAGIVGFLVLPGVFVCGLGLIPFGLLVYRAQLKERIEAVTSKPFSALRLFGILTVVNQLVVGIAGYQRLHYMDSVQFCGTTCHTVMEPQYVAYLDSPHARVSCVDCHIGPGASWFVKSKLYGVLQVAQVVLQGFDLLDQVLGPWFQHFSQVFHGITQPLGGDTQLVQVIETNIRPGDPLVKSLYGSQPPVDEHWRDVAQPVGQRVASCGEGGACTGTRGL